ncbi:MAG: RNA polymerase sigma factor [Candidatus Promineifilaceae bacterium]
MKSPPTKYADSVAWYADCQSADSQAQASAYEALFVYLSRAALHIVRDQPEPEALAQDCAQTALIRIHERLEECRHPAAFRTWSRQIVSNLALDALRRRSKLTFTADDELEMVIGETAENAPAPEAAVAAADHESALYEAINRAPISDRSRRVVIGRYLQDLPDEPLAEKESELVGQTVLPSHIQVTRAKNIAKLRNWEPLLTLLEMI